MLHLLDDAIETYLRAEVPLSGGDVDIVFQRPDKEWGAAVTRPTVNIFLWDVRRNSGTQEAGIETVEENGKLVRRQPQPRVDCRYMVTAWAGDVRDEHQLLGAVLGAFLRHSEMLPVHLTGPLATVRPYPSIQVPRFDGSDTADFWTAVGGELRPAIDVIISATFDAAALSEAGPPVRRLELVAERTNTPQAREMRVREAPDPTPVE
jgi:hypothetical protein